MSLHFPRWSTDLARRRLRLRSARRPPGRPEGSEPDALVLVREAAGRQLVEQACAASAAAGVRPGMTVAHARALLGRSPLAVLPREPEREARALVALAEWATRFSPICAPHPPDGLLLDVGGCERLFGGERRLVDAAVDGVRALGIGARGAVAATAGCAWALARFGPAERATVPAGGEREALAPLPVAALGSDTETSEALGEVGIERVEHLFALERGALAARFGEELLLRLDRATGEALEALDPVRPTAAPLAERLFPGVLGSLEAVLANARELLFELTRLLEARESGARRIAVTLARPDLPAWRAELTLSRPNRSAGHLWPLLERKLERAHLGYGVEGIALAAPLTGALRGRQEDPWSEDAAEHEHRRSFAELVDALASHLGAGRSSFAETVETHVPERAFRRRSATEERSAAHRGRARVAPFERPTLLFRRPEPLEVIAATPDGPPAWLRWRGSEERVLSRFGPERIAAPWWRADGLRARDYFKIQDARGRWLWVFRAVESGRWFVHGEWS